MSEVGLKYTLPFNYNTALVSDSLYANLEPKKSKVCSPTRAAPSGTCA